MAVVDAYRPRSCWRLVAVRAPFWIFRKAVRELGPCDAIFPGGVGTPTLDLAVCDPGSGVPTASTRFGEGDRVTFRGTKPGGPPPKPAGPARKNRGGGRLFGDQGRRRSAPPRPPPPTRQPTSARRPPARRPNAATGGPAVAPCARGPGPQATADGSTAVRLSFSDPADSPCV